MQRADVLPLFRQTWGASLEALCAAPGAPLVLPAGRFEAAPELAVSITRELVRWLWSRNQFLELDQAGEDALRDSVTRALTALDRAPAEALARHRDELAAFVCAQLGPRPRDVVSAAYSPELQLSVLGLDLGLLGPVLDVGCGADATLVHFLRARGIEAEGLDRAGGEGFGGDWLAYDYGSARWGTVLSHLGLALHFLHHHLAPGERAYAYARTYMAILRSLRAGGSFVYAPGLPFLEPLLDAALYRVRRVPFAGALRVAPLDQLEAETGLSLSYAAHVQRVG